MPKWEYCEIWVSSNEMEVKYYTIDGVKIEHYSLMKKKKGMFGGDEYDEAILPLTIARLGQDGWEAFVAGPGSRSWFFKRQIE